MTNYVQRVSKKQIPTCNILGVDIAAINMEWLIDFTTKNIKELSGDYMCVSNVHTTIMAYEDEKYCYIQNGGIMAIPDGGPLSVIGRRKGYCSMKRTTGPDYMEEIFKCSEKRGYRHFFYGSKEETLEQMVDNLQKAYPKMQIVGTYSPPFREMTECEDGEVIKKINDCAPDFVWIGLGAPKQEKWMATHQGKINGFMVGVGAGFDYFAGKIKRAPKWMQKYSLEWLYRLLQDPHRLFRRYLYTNTKFIWYTVIRGK